MCGTCGCNEPPQTFTAPRVTTRHLSLETSLLAANDNVAETNRRYFLDRGILAVNLVSGPGAGKTALLEATARHYRKHQHGETNRPPLHVIEGDQQTDNDARRVRDAGAIAHQINTGHLCHLEAMHIRQSLQALPPVPKSLLIIENVGNLVCPASFDLGEQLRIVVISTTEGDDKPLKYPDIVADADLLIISKADLSPYVDFDIQRCMDNARRIRPGLEALVLSAKSGEGMTHWLQWLEDQQRQFQQEINDNARPQEAGGDEPASTPPASSDLR